jgi:hypothetical protein
MLFKGEKKDVYGENHMKNINTLSGVGGKHNF